MCPGYETKQSDGEASVILELSGMRSTPLSALVTGPFRSGVVEYDRALFMNQIELNCVPMDS